MIDARFMACARIDMTIFTCGRWCLCLHVEGLVGYQAFPTHSRQVMPQAGGTPARIDPTRSIPVRDRYPSRTRRRRRRGGAKRHKSSAATPSAGRSTCHLPCLHGRCWVLLGNHGASRARAPCATPVPSQSDRGGPLDTSEPGSSMNDETPIAFSAQRRTRSYRPQPCDPCTGKSRPDFPKANPYRGALHRLAGIGCQ